MRKVSIVALLLAVLVQPARAEVTGDTCLRLAETITAGARKSYSDRQYNAMRQYANCEASQSSSSGGLDAAITVFSLGAKFSEDQKKKSCTTDNSQTNFSARDYNEVKVIFNQTLKTIDNCLALAGRGWIINAAYIQNDAISVSIANTSPTGGRIDAIDLFPKTSITCEGIPKKFPVVVTSSGFNLTCQRDGTTQIVDGIVYSSARDATINLRLAEQPFPITIPGYTQSALQNVQHQLDAVNANIGELKTGLKGWPSGPEASGNNVGGGDAKGPTMCPNGTYAVGLKWWGAPGSTRFCVGCASGFQIVCRSLNADQTTTAEAKK